MQGPLGCVKLHAHPIPHVCTFAGLNMRVVVMPMSIFANWQILSGTVGGGGDGQAGEGEGEERGEGGERVCNYCTHKRGPTRL